MFKSGFGAIYISPQLSTWDFKWTSFENKKFPLTLLSIQVSIHATCGMAVVQVDYDSPNITGRLKGVDREVQLPPANVRDRATDARQPRQRIHP